MDAIAEHHPVGRLRLFLIGGLVAAGFVVAGIVLGSATPAQADEGDGLLGSVTAVVSDAAHPVASALPSWADEGEATVGEVIAAVPEPVSAAVDPVGAPATGLVSAVAESIPDAPVAAVLDPVADLVDPLIPPVTAVVPGLDGVLDSVPVRAFPSGVIGVVHDAVGRLLSTTGAASAETGGAGAALTRATPPSISPPFSATRGSGSAPPVPVAPAPPPGGSPAALPTPPGSGGGHSGGGSAGATALDTASDFLLWHACDASRALDSDDALPASPTFDPGSTPD